MNTVSDKRKLNIKRSEVFQVADLILMCINVECNLKGVGRGGTKLIRVKHEKFVAKLDDFLKKKCRYFIEKLDH